MWRNRKFSATRLNRGEILGTEDFSSVRLPCCFNFLLLLLGSSIQFVKYIANAKAKTALALKLAGLLEDRGDLHRHFAAPATASRKEGPWAGLHACLVGNSGR